MIEYVGEMHRRGADVAEVKAWLANTREFCIAGDEVAI